MTFFFPQPTWRSHPSTNFDAKWLTPRGFTRGRAFGSKNRYFLKPLTPRPSKPPKFAQFCSGRNAKSDVNGSKLQQFLITMQNFVAIGRRVCENEDSDKKVKGKKINRLTVRKQKSQHYARPIMHCEL